MIRFAWLSASTRESACRRGKRIPVPSGGTSSRIEMTRYTCWKCRTEIFWEKLTGRQFHPSRSGYRVGMCPSGSKDAGVATNTRACSGRSTSPRARASTCASKSPANRRTPDTEARRTFQRVIGPRLARPGTSGRSSGIPIGTSGASALPDPHLLPFQHP